MISRQLVTNGASDLLLIVGHLVGDTWLPRWAHVTHHHQTVHGDT